MRPIDADELLGIEKILSTGVRSTEARVLMEQVIFDIQQSLTINPEDLRPKGKWIEKPYLLGTSRFCSLCGENYGMPHGIYNYCPNCGARMED